MKLKDTIRTKKSLISAVESLSDDLYRHIDSLQSSIEYNNDRIKEYKETHEDATDDSYEIAYHTECNEGYKSEIEAFEQIAKILEKLI